MTENTRNQLTAIAVAFTFWHVGRKAFAAGASKPGLPQLDVATWPSQLFWLVVLFGAGYLVMAKIVTPRIGAVLEERRQTLNGDLEKARNASAEAAKIRADYESDLEKARSEAAEFAKQAAAEAAKKRMMPTPRLPRSWPIKLRKPKLNWPKPKTSAMANLNDVAADAAVAAVARLPVLKPAARRLQNCIINRNETCQAGDRLMEQEIVLESVWVAVGFIVFIALVWRKAGGASAECLTNVQKKSAVS